MSGHRESLDKLETESQSSGAPDLSRMTVYQIMKAMNRADSSVPAAVHRSLRQICEAAEAVSSTVNNGGRVFYIAAGTGGRIAMQDAAELPPTFGFRPEVFQAIIAGGARARAKAIENAEDDEKAAAAVLKRRKAGQRDTVIGITASGRTPFVVSALRYASAAGCRTIGLSSNAGSPITKIVDMPVVIETGPELIAGSTRLKAGTAQKLVLNMISTYAGIRAGKVVGNMMVGMKATNEKLRNRALSIVTELTGASREKARKALVKFDYDISKSVDHLKNSP